MSEVDVNVDVPVIIGSKEDTDMQEFLKNAAEKRAKDIALSIWHINLYIHSNGVVPLPWEHDSQWITVNVSDYVKNEETGKWETVYDEQKTLARLSAIAKFASKQKGVTVEKKYDNTQFDLIVTIPVVGGPSDSGERIKYIANRNVVCEKRVVGTKVIPAQVIEERIEEIVEWDCNPISLLGFDATATDDNA